MKADKVTQMLTSVGGVGTVGMALQQSALVEPILRVSDHSVSLLGGLSSSAYQQNAASLGG